MPFRSLADEIADDFAEVAGQGREFFGDGFLIRGKHLAPTGVPTRARPNLESGGARVRVPGGAPSNILDELVGTTWGNEASREADQRRRRSR
jgi:hypothetical protein